MSVIASTASNVIELNAARRREARIVAAARVISIDYRSIVENAIAGLAENTPDSRREVYVQARNVVRRHLMLMRLPEPIIELEQLSLDLTIRRIERQWRSRQTADVILAAMSDANRRGGRAAAGKALAALGTAASAIMRFGVRPAVVVSSTLLWPVRVILRPLMSPLGLSLVVPIALIAIIVVFFVDNGTIYKRLADSGAGRWLSELDLAAYMPSLPGRKAADQAASGFDDAATSADRGPSPAAVVDASRPGAGDSPPYRGATRVRPIRADLTSLMTAAAATPDAPAPVRAPSPCDDIPLPSDRISCAIGEHGKSGLGPKSRARWFAGYAAINDFAATHPIIQAVADSTSWPVATSFGAADTARPATPVARSANAKVVALLDSGRKWSTRGDLDRALHDFTEAIRLDPKYPDGYHERGQALFKMGETERAIADYSAAIQRDPQFGAALRSRGMAYLYRGTNDLALADLTRAIALAESDPSTLAPIELFYAHRSRAQIYGGKQQYALEVADCTAVIDSYAGNPMLANELKQNYADVGAANVIATVYRQRATAYIRLANWEAAISDLTAAIPLSYDHGFTALVDRSKIHEGLGQRDEAIADLQGALGVRPGSEEVRIALRRLGILAKPPPPVNVL